MPTMAARPHKPDAAREVHQIRLTQAEKRDWNAEAERLARHVKVDSRGGLAKLIRALFKQHLSKPASERNKIRDFFE